MSESVKLESLLGMLTIRLNDDNFINWNFQFCYVLLSRPKPRIKVNLGLERESHLNYNLTNIIKSVT